MSSVTSPHIASCSSLTFDPPIALSGGGEVYCNAFSTIALAIGVDTPSDKVGDGVGTDSKMEFICL